MKAKKGIITKEGMLIIQRGNELKPMTCMNYPLDCSDSCAGFGEPEAVLRSGMKITELKICCGIWEFTEFTDQRKGRVK